MTTSKFCIRKVLLKIDAKRLCEKNQQKCIDCPKPRSNKNELGNKCSCSTFYAPIIKVFRL